jgi:membrane protease YdiL (CAAX protease family)
MLFLLKRTWKTGLIALLVLAGLGLALRSLLGAGAPLTITLGTALLGVGVFAGVLCSDLLLHGVFQLLFGQLYRQRYQELAGIFRAQSQAAMWVGATLAGVGEELVFRGLGTGTLYLVSAAVVFGLLHHIRRALWPFSLWAIWEGLLFALALSLTGALFVTMVAHFLHDLAGFAVFRHRNRVSASV